MKIDLHGEILQLRGDRTIVWPRKKTLILADPHFGKAAAFRAAGIPVPGHGEGALTRLSQAIAETEAERLIILGDFWHSRTGHTKIVGETLTQWRSDHAQLQIEILRGNHDRSSQPPKSWADHWHATLVDPPLHFAHHPMISGDGFVLAGHLHPGISLFGPHEKLRLPCFWQQGGCLVLPAFGSFTGLSSIQPQPSDRVFVIAEADVIEWKHGG